MSASFDQNTVSGRKVIDFHTHPYRKRGEFMGMYGEHFYLEPEQMPEDLAEAGISVFCGSVIDSDHRGAMESFDRVREVNDAALELREKFGDIYVPGFHVHPAFLKESLAEVERMHREGVRLVGELVPYLQGWQHAGCDYGSSRVPVNTAWSSATTRCPSGRSRWKRWSEAIPASPSWRRIRAKRQIICCMSDA